MRYDVVIIGGGLSGIAAGCELQKRGLHTAAVSFGVSLHEPDYGMYRKLGGRMFMGDKVVSGLFEDGKLKAVFTSNFGDIPLEADNFILATGKFLSGGLQADMEKVTETTLGLDVCYNDDHCEWYNPDFFERQSFMSFGVKVDGQGHPYLNGIPVLNLYPIGEIVAGCDITVAGTFENIIQEAVSTADKI